MTNTFGQKFSLIGIIYLIYCPKTSQNGSIGSGTQKNEMHLPDNVDNGKYPEVKTWQPEAMGAI